jgi:two-component system, chemotaxis family, CheB/CheR fusion protein
MKRQTKKTEAKAKKTPRKASGKARFPKATNENQQRVNQPFPIVGVGASAGGLEAFRELLKHLPTNTGMALVLVQHLDPKHESMLAELLGRSTKLPVSEVENGTRVEPNHIYVIPRNSEMTIRNSVLHLHPRDEGRGQHHSIDNFLRSLAEDQTNRAIAIILSGTATDGTLGLEAIKGEGGITFAQDAGSAKYDSMPRSAVASGCVDFVLQPEGIAKELARISNHPYVVSVEEPTSPEVESTEPARNGFKRILNILQKAHGVDFTLYKINTLERRTMRRMLLNKVEGYDEYARYLNAHPEEVENLYQDILINVTSFFRQPETFELLKKRIFPQIIDSRPNDEPVRVWVLGCSTGEEAYSIAMAFAELTSDRSDHIPVQIFATDVNDRGIEKARAGLYSKNITEDISADRLRRFFIEEDGGYRVSKPIRDMCVFAQQNILADPPFSRMDLISCRNLLIYLDPTAQKKVIPLLHYALNPTGFMWLGSSETVGSAADLFEAEDKKHKFYAKKPIRARRGFEFPLGSLAQGRERFSRATVRTGPDRGGDETEVLNEADRIIMSRFAPASVLINENFDILQFRGRTAAYLEPPPGKATLNVLKMAREGLVVPLRAALIKARKNYEVVRKEELRVQHNGSLQEVNLEVIPIRRGARGRYFLVLFESAGAAAEKETTSKQPRSERETETSEVKVLTEELSSTRDYLQSMVEQYEAATEELQSANEEIQSSNEELQSINEELETAKEELESSNEELTTVNEELQNRNAELGRANSDLVNLIGSVQMPMVMLDSDLRIRRFTTTAEKALNLIASDVGRNIGDIKTNIYCPDLDQLITEVIDTVNVRELEVQDTRGRWYLMRIRPYKTVENKIDGAVLVLVDIDALKRHEAQLQESRDYAVAIIDTVLPLVILDESLRVQSANRSFYDFFRVSPEETEGEFVYELENRQWDDPKLRKLLANVVSSGAEFQDFEIESEFPSGARATMLLSAREIRHEASRRRLILLGIQDVTSAKKMERERDELIVRERAARAAAEDSSRVKDEFLAICSHELRAPLSAIQGWAEMLTRGELDEETSRHALEVILRNVRAQTQIIKDLLDVSRVIAGKLRLNIGAVDLIPLVEATIESARAGAEAKGLELTVCFDENVGPFFGDVLRLQQIVWNLLSNAIKFTPKGGTIHVRLERENDSVKIVVEDTGIGIEPEFLPHVFDLFRQADSRTNRSYGGLGLGLAIVRNLTTLHGGTVRAESSGAGKGSTFEVILPPKPPADESEDESETGLNLDVNADLQSIAEGARPLEGARVIVVDDDPDSREMLNAALTAIGGEVRTCTSSAEALKTIKEWVPDFLVSDIGMPGEDGYTLIRHVRELPAERGGNIPALALTGYATLDDHHRALAAGYQMHMAKPVELGRLAAVAARLVERSRPARSEAHSETPQAPEL